LIRPAISLASDGFAMSGQLAFSIRTSEELLGRDAGCRNVFLRSDPPRAGMALTQPDLARTLEDIAQSGRSGFYGGRVGQAIVSFMRERGGLITGQDLDRDQAVWGRPLSIRYRDCTVFEQPLPSQGFTTLEALNIVEELDLRQRGLTESDTVHAAAEAMRLAFSDRDTYAGDPEAVDVPVKRLLSKDHAAKLRGTIPERSVTQPVRTHGGDTTSFAVADEHGNVVTFIQSIFAVWGAAAMVPGTGVLLNNRMTGFSLDPASPNMLRPGMRTVHTLNTWMVDRDDGQLFAGGTPGAHFQVQANLQNILGIAEWRLDPQTAIDAPKWAWSNGRLTMESRFPDETFHELGSRGYAVDRLDAWATQICRAQIVGRHYQAGRLLAASDLRSEGCALAF
jgi:gamma-glutamyltranspeptidase/glutathione hydrolase